MLIAWILVGLVWGLRSPNSDSLRCTFLSVGHGGCREGSSQRSAVGSLAGDPSWPHLMKGGNAGAASCRFGEPSVAGAGGGWSLVDVPLSAASM